MYTIDASVHVSALNSAEPHSAASQAFLELVQSRGSALFSPTLLAVEVAAAIANALGDAGRAVGLAAALCDLPNQTLIPLDEALASQAASLAAGLRLRGADAAHPTGT